MCLISFVVGGGAYPTRQAAEAKHAESLQDVRDDLLQPLRVDHELDAKLSAELADVDATISESSTWLENVEREGESERHGASKAQREAAAALDGDGDVSGASGGEADQAWNATLQAHFQAQEQRVREAADALFQSAAPPLPPPPNTQQHD